jgi:hypothetical protein
VVFTIFCFYFCLKSGGLDLGGSEFGLDLIEKRDRFWFVKDVDFGFRNMDFIFY